MSKRVSLSNDAEDELHALRKTGIPMCKSYEVKRSGDGSINSLEVRIARQDGGKRPHYDVTYAVHNGESTIASLLRINRDDTDGRGPSNGIRQILSVLVAADEAARRFDEIDEVEGLDHWIAERRERMSGLGKPFGGDDDTVDRGRGIETDGGYDCHEPTNQVACLLLTDPLCNKRLRQLFDDGIDRGGGTETDGGTDKLLIATSRCGTRRWHYPSDGDREQPECGSELPEADGWRSIDAEYARAHYEPCKKCTGEAASKSNPGPQLSNTLEDLDPDDVLTDGGTEYLFRVFCEWCDEYSEWFETAERAKTWKQEHLDDGHDNPWATRAVRVQRYPADEVDEHGNIILSDGGEEMVVVNVGKFGTGKIHKPSSRDPETPQCNSPGEYRSVERLKVEANRDRCSKCYAGHSTAGGREENGPSEKLLAMDPDDLATDGGQRMVVVARAGVSNDYYHEPDDEDPAQPACHTRQHRGWRRVARENLPDDMELCNNCRGDIEMSDQDREAYRALLDAEPDDLLTDGGQVIDGDCEDSDHDDRRKADLPIRVALPRTRLWIHDWLADEQGNKIAYLCRFDADKYDAEKIAIDPETIQLLRDEAIGVWDIAHWQSPAWADPDAPINGVDGALEADGDPDSYRGKLATDGGSEPEPHSCDVCEYGDEVRNKQICPECGIGRLTSDVETDGGDLPVAESQKMKRAANSIARLLTSDEVITRD